MRRNAVLYKKDLDPKRPIKIFQAAHKVLPPYHYHNVNQILFVLKGYGKLLLKGIEYNINEFDLIILNKNDAHKFFPVHPEVMILYIIEYSDKIFDNSSESKKLLKFLKNIKDDEKIIPINCSGLLSIPMLFKEMLFESQHKNSNYYLILKAHLYEILVLITRYIENKDIFFKSPNKLRLTSTEKRVLAIIRYIDTHYYERISLNEMARKSALSTRQFTRLFKKLTNMTFKEYINKLRIDKAKQLLAMQEMEIAAICFEVGFEELSHFYRIFKRETGLTPKEFISNLNK